MSEGTDEMWAEISRRQIKAGQTPSYIPESIREKEFINRALGIGTGTLSEEDIKYLKMVVEDEKNRGCTFTMYSYAGNTPEEDKAKYKVEATLSRFKYQALINAVSILVGEE
jgi:hypothetical protein